MAMEKPKTSQTVFSVLTVLSGKGWEKIGRGKFFGREKKSDDMDERKELSNQDLLSSKTLSFHPEFWLLIPKSYAVKTSRPFQVPAV